MDHLPDVHYADHQIMDQIPDSQMNRTELEISEHYEGAPELVSGLLSNFATI